MLNDSVIDKLQDEALSYLAGHLDKRYSYHNAQHTLEVCNGVKLFADQCDLPRSDYSALRIASIFHDFGYLERDYDNEKLAFPYMEDFGRRFNIPQQLLILADKLIMETAFPYFPVTPAGKLLCDADIEYIGRECFLTKAELFRQELAAGGVVYTDEQWWKLEMEFLQKNHFFTDVCRKLRDAGRVINIGKVQDILLNSGREK